MITPELQHSHGVTLSAFWDLSSWAEEEEAAARHRRYQALWGAEGEAIKCVDQMQRWYPAALWCLREKEKNVSLTLSPCLLGLGSG